MRRFERLANGLFPQLKKECPAFLRHKMCLVSPNLLRQHSIPYNKIVQHKNEIMITFPCGYHSGFNTGNFVTWVLRFVFVLLGEESCRPKYSEWVYLTTEHPACFKML